VSLKSVTIELSLFGFAALRTALGLVLKSLLSVEFLFTIGESEFLLAVSADNGFVGHVGLLCFFRDRTFLGFPENTRNGRMGMLNRI
jgi:hypothetical protein